SHARLTPAAYAAATAATTAMGPSSAMGYPAVEDVEVDLLERDEGEVHDADDEPQLPQEADPPAASRLLLRRARAPDHHVGQRDRDDRRPGGDRGRQMHPERAAPVVVRELDERGERREVHRPRGDR